jgi:hypothetical protein
MHRLLVMKVYDVASFKDLLGELSLRFANL